MNYVNKRNEYIKIRRERRNYEKDSGKPKLLYRYVNSKLKNKGEIRKLKINDEIHEDAEEMVEVMKNSFQSVFTGENDFHCQSNGNKRGQFV